MKRLHLAACLLLLAPAALSACGGNNNDSSAADPTATLTDAEARRTEIARGLEQPVPPDTPMPTPTPLPDDLPIIQVVAPGAQPFTPTKEQFRELPTTTLTVSGTEYTGVTLATLAARVGAPAGSVATIQGTRLDNLRFGAIRYPLAQVGETTLLVVNEAGYLNLVSTSIPQEQWLHTLTGIAFQ